MKKMTERAIEERERKREKKKEREKEREREREKNPFYDFIGTILGCFLLLIFSTRQVQHFQTQIRKMREREMKIKKLH